MQDWWGVSPAQIIQTVRGIKLLFVVKWNSGTCHYMTENKHAACHVSPFHVLASELSLDS